ncbi:MAG: D-2-hydroxyacid dehydrogenase [bacterium]|nr:D-2-hydroxyacid dehydrogenase [bacterium]
MKRSVLIHTGRAKQDALLREAIERAFPQVRVVTAASETALRELLPEVEIILGWSMPSELLAQASRLRWYQVIGAGVEPLVAARDRLHGVMVTNLRGPFGGPMAEYALTYALAHLQRLRAVEAAQRRRVWEPFIPARLDGSTVGIAGLGAVGVEIAQRFAALRAHVIGVRRSAGAAAHVERVYPLAEIDAFLARCDVLVLALPATEETRGFLSSDRLAMLKAGCFLINVGRGSAVAERDLLTALDRGWIAGAALDVFEEEPLSADSALWSREEVFITPHISGINRPEDVLPPLLDNLRLYLAGEPLQNVVDLVRGY